MKWLIIIILLNDSYLGVAIFLKFGTTEDNIRTSEFFGLLVRRTSCFQILFRTLCICSPLAQCTISIVTISSMYCVYCHHWLSVSVYFRLHGPVWDACVVCGVTSVPQQTPGEPGPSPLHQWNHWDGMLLSQWQSRYPLSWWIYFQET